MIQFHMCSHHQPAPPSTSSPDCLLAPPLVLRDVGIHDHAHRLHATRDIDHTTSTTATHHVSTTPRRFRPGHVNTATSTPATSTMPHQCPPCTPRMKGHENRRMRRRWDKEVGQGESQREGGARMTRATSTSHINPQQIPRQPRATSTRATST